MTLREFDEFAELVIQAYRSKGLRPRSGAFGVTTGRDDRWLPEHSVCPPGALIAGECRVTEPGRDSLFVTAEHVTGRRLSWAFVDGFDGKELDWRETDCEGKSNLSTSEEDHTLGRHVRRALTKAGLMPAP